METEIGDGDEDGEGAVNLHTAYLDLWTQKRNVILWYVTRTSTQST